MVNSRRCRQLLFWLVLFIMGAALADVPRQSRAQGAEEHILFLPLLRRQSPYYGKTYVPLAYIRHGSWLPPYGVELWQGRMQLPIFRRRSEELGVGYVRLNSLSWSDVQPIEGGPYNWNALTLFERELRGAAQAGLWPMVVVDDAPAWATINDPFPTGCGAIREDRFADFARFMVALVERYGSPPYNVRLWELGNEPDVDPTLVEPNNQYGCWGKISDPYYGGEHYGNMLKVVTPAIKAADRNAQVLIGGLLLNSPASLPDQGKPENFLEGILRSGAAPFFDMVPYHAYSYYTHEWLDTDRYHPAWLDWGGIMVGKARFLRSVMARYGVDKPLVLNETGFLCLPYYSMCPDPIPAFYELQANHLVRGMVRVAAENIGPIIWHTLNGPGWSQTGLLYANQQPRLGYLAYQEYLRQIRGSAFSPVPVGYDDNEGVEAYRFTAADRTVDVVWSIDTEPDRVSLPPSQLLAAYTREGVLIEPELSDGTAYFTVGFAPIYIHRQP